MKLTKNNLARGTALATAILWVLCSVFVVVFPDFSHKVTVWWMHGMEIKPYNINLGSFIWGGITLVASFWLVGFVLGWSMELVSKNAKK